ncbi:SDR family NAD(P)-dependent oxidoreductase [Roseateles sp. P5_E11]
MSIILVTGGSRGIGASAAVECAKRGEGVILTYRSDANRHRASVTLNVPETARSA